MNNTELVGFILTLVVMLAGFLGSILPCLPSTPLVLLAAIIHRIAFGSESASTLVLALLIVLTLLSLAFEYLASLLGAKKMGATWRGALGAGLGALVGIFFGIPGLLIGPFAGAVIFETLHGREWREATRAGVGALIGLALAAVAKAGCCIAMIFLFTVNVLYRNSVA